MFINRPTEKVQTAAREHVSGPITTVIPISWGIGLSTAGIFSFVFTYVLVGTIIGSVVPNWALAVIMCGPMALALGQTARGKIGQGLLAMTAVQDSTDEGSAMVVLQSKRLSAFTPNGAVHRTYPTGTPTKLVTERKWWQGMKYLVGDETYFINPNYNDEVRITLNAVST